MLGEAIWDSSFIYCQLILYVFMHFTGVIQQSLPATQLTAGGPLAASRVCHTGY